MTNIQLLITIIILLAAISAIALLLRNRLQYRRAAQQRLAVMHELLETAQGQNELFDISVKRKDAKHNALSGMLSSVGDTLEMEILSYVSPELSGEEVEVYFRIRSTDGLAFYKFTSTVQHVQGNIEKSRISLQFPADITAGQKRQFFRVNPPKETVRVIGLWDLPVGKPAPRDTSEIGRPLLHYKYGTGNETVQVSDISGTGVALRFPMPDPSCKPVDLEEGTQVLCLIVYHMGKDGRMVTFWCTCTVLNIREQQDPPALVLGMKFTNWAVLEHGKSEINWFHSKQDSGVSPITQWVMQVDREQRKLL
ncbi:MAG: PilZ domain-containing protein [Desulfovibrio sp.]|nr:PilZ domain-containing protein [Desulfovibrio sp.]